MIRHLLAGATAILNSLNNAAATPTAPGSPNMDVRETCSCGASLMLEGPFDGATLTAWVDRWRKEHPCQPNAKDATHIGTGAQTERAWAEPHRADSDLTTAVMRRIGFNPKGIA